MGSGLEEEAVESQWKYFESLYFLKDNITPRKMVGNIVEESKTHIDEQESFPNSPCNSSIDVVNDFDETSFSEKHTENPSSGILSFEEGPSSKKKKGRNDVMQDLLAIEKQKLLQFNEIQANSQKKKNDEDEDFYFLMSLLPHLREIPKHRKLAVRLKLQNVVMAEQTENTTGSSNTFTPSTFFVNSSIPSYYMNQPEYSSSNCQSNIKNTIPCGQTNLNPTAVDNTCLSSWQNINNE
ncbi:uncharacterized protein LOC132941857 [Metopolophium dirhodum]|uniref:uncharacterized protein LOC132941857 n=1 Tax=Metopolophium dirhodum TaxID=44670 RepID=UPI00298FA699|nr:uncharacterized protein LOC132941857 [Metopolophium dirhodum]